MTLRICPSTSTCPDDSPLDNYSSEANDNIDYISTQYAGQPAPLLHDWTATSCSDTFVSTISQQDADLQAKAAAQACLIKKECPDCSTNRTLFTNNPQSCCSPCPDGSVSCTLVPGGVVAALTQFEADQLAHALACQLAQKQKNCLLLTTGPTTQMCVNVPYSSQLTANVDVVWNVQGGGLPPGLTSSTTSRLFAISGTPTLGGNFSIIIRATTSSSLGTNYVDRLITFCVVAIGPNTLQNATKNIPYQQNLAVDSCSVGTWTIVSGSLPPGLSINPTTGTISGTPTTAGTYPFTVGFG